LLQLLLATLLALEGGLDLGRPPFRLRQLRASLCRHEAGMNLLRRRGGDGPHDSGEAGEYGDVRTVFQMYVKLHMTALQRSD
jgi:hypothetical protein